MALAALLLQALLGLELVVLKQKGKKSGPCGHETSLSYFACFE